MIPQLHGCKSIFVSCIHIQLFTEERVMLLHLPELHNASRSTQPIYSLTVVRKWGNFVISLLVCWAILMALLNTCFSLRGEPSLLSSSLLFLVSVAAVWEFCQQGAPVYLSSLKRMCTRLELGNRWQGTALLLPMPFVIGAR